MMRTVGVAPGTFTLQLGAPPCPPDPPNVVPGSYMPAVVPSDVSTMEAYNPYGTQSQLKGPPSTATVVVTVAGLLGLAGVLFVVLLPKPRRARR